VLCPPDANSTTHVQRVGVTSSMPSITRSPAPASTFEQEVPASTKLVALVCATLQLPSSLSHQLMPAPARWDSVNRGGIVSEDPVDGPEGQAVDPLANLRIAALLLQPVQEMEPWSGCGESTRPH
jgi:hypothetical protein